MWSTGSYQLAGSPGVPSPLSPPPDFVVSMTMAPFRASIAASGPAMVSTPHAPTARAETIPGTQHDAIGAKLGDSFLPGLMASILLPCADAPNPGGPVPGFFRPPAPVP